MYVVDSLKNFLDIINGVFVFSMQIRFLLTQILTSFNLRLETIIRFEINKLLLDTKESKQYYCRDYCTNTNDIFNVT